MARPKTVLPVGDPRVERRGLQRSTGDIATRERASLVGLIVLAALWFGWATWTKSAPTSFSDEAGNLGNARWLAGGTLWPMGASSSSAMGYPALIAPIYALVDSPALTYRLVIGLNVVLAAALVGVLYAVAKRVLHAGHWAALAGAACGAAYPAVAVQAGVAWVEVTSMLGMALFVLTILVAVRRLSPAVLLSHGALAGFLAAVHGRFTLLPVLAALGLLTIAVVRPRMRWWAVGAAALALALDLGFGRLEDAVLKARWTFVFAPDISLKQLLALSPVSELRSLAGQGWYLVAGTGGLVLVGVTGLLRAAAARPPADRQTEPDDPPDDPPAPDDRPAPDDHDAPDGRAGIGGPVAAVYLGLVLAGIFLISVSYMAIYLTANPTIARADLLYYGRYSECVVPTVVAVAVVVLLDRASRRAAVIGLGTAALLGPALLGISWLVRGNLKFTGIINPYMTTALDPYFGMSTINLVRTWGFVVPAVIAGTVVTVALIILVVLRRQFVPVLLIAVFTVLALLDLHQLSRIPGLAGKDIPKYERMRDLDPQVVAFDPKSVGVYMQYSLPFWLDRSRFVGFDSSATAWPAANIYIGPSKWPAAATHGLKLLLVETVSGRGVYVPKK